jgi:uncharacterized membrane protein YuzA (DUF378 family)
MNKLHWVEWLILALLTIGGLNWGLVGLLDFDLVSFLFGDRTWLSLVVYDLVGIAAVASLFVFGKLRKT